MNQELSSFAARLREFISPTPTSRRISLVETPPFRERVLSRQFDALALELFSLQFKYNLAYRKICEARAATPDTVGHWTQVPTVPTSAFKELALTSLLPEERTTVFHSSGTIGQQRSCHFHTAESLALYEQSLWKQFTGFFGTDCGETVFLTPNARLAPHSSLVHMFETIRQKHGLPASVFTGTIADDGSWLLDFQKNVAQIKQACDTNVPLRLMGTAFSFVHLLDHLQENNLRFVLPAGSSVMETGGYKNRSRVLPKAELHQLITEFLGVPDGGIICEYGMSELSSQAYETTMLAGTPLKEVRTKFFFPHWTKLQFISPETGREVADGETGLICIFDLANVFSVAAIQTEDLGVRWGHTFKLIGRAQLAEPRGCSLMTA
jgi:hypothetical protein